LSLLLYLNSAKGPGINARVFRTIQVNIIDAHRTAPGQKLAFPNGERPAEAC
jgi:hypothetical protein